MAARPVIEYYFSFISSWSYVGSRRLQQLALNQHATIQYKPVNLPHIFSVSGGLPVKQRSPQRQAYRLLELERWAKLRDIPIVKQPKFAAANPSLAHRVLLAAIEEHGNEHVAVGNFARKGLETVWVDEADIGNPETIVEVADASGLEGSRLLERANGENGLRIQEKGLTAEAESKQYFGAPFYVLNGEPFWGQDRLEMLEETIQSGREPLQV